MAFKTPGVYVQEISKFPPSVAQVETAIPAFIGYTEKAVDRDGNSLKKVPTRIRSLVEYEEFYGGDYKPSTYTVTLAGSVVDGLAVKKFYLYKSLQLFFDNGGGACYIVSVGDYDDSVDDLDNSNPADPQGLKPGLDSLQKIDEVTLILFPDAVGSNDDGATALNAAQLGNLQGQTLAQCAKLQDRFGVFDILEGWDETSSTAVDDFRNQVGSNNLKYGAVYHPWLQTIYTPKVGYRQLAFVDPGDVTIPNATLQTLSSDANINALVTAVLNRQVDTTAVLATLSSVTTGLTVDNFKPLRKHYDNTVNAFLNGSGTRTQFGNIIAFLRAIVAAFNSLDGAPLQSDFSARIDGMKSDAELIKAITDLIRIEKNPAIMSDIMLPGDGSRVATDVDADYTVGNTAWTGNLAMTAITLNAETTINIAGGADIKAKGSIVLRAGIYVKTMEKLIAAMESIFAEAAGFESTAEFNLFTNHPVFKNVNDLIVKEVTTVPPSGAVVGIYSAVDGSRGVWKAPANVSLSSVFKPAFKITNDDQDLLNVDSTSGKSVNAIRAFTGKGILIWGARTLAGNDNEWRYVSVRRFFNMVEESVKKATWQFVFEPNDSNTWVKVRSMIANFLTTMWRQGALAGATPDDAFFVNVGLGETMTAIDILEGRMIVEIGMAAVRPAEFIILKFSHKMQES